MVSGERSGESENKTVLLFLDYCVLIINNINCNKTKRRTTTSASASASVLPFGQTLQTQDTDKKTKEEERGDVFCVYKAWLVTN